MIDDNPMPPEMRRHFPDSPFVMSFTEYDPSSKSKLLWTLYEDVNSNQDLSLIPEDFMGKWGNRFAWGIGCKLPTN